MKISFVGRRAHAMIATLGVDQRSQTFMLIPRPPGSFALSRSRRRLAPCSGSSLFPVTLPRHDVRMQ